MKVTEVKVRKLESSTRMKGVATITIDDCFVVHDIKIIEGEEGLFVAMPSRNINGEFKDIAHPINPETRELIQEAIISEFNK